MLDSWFPNCDRLSKEVIEKKDGSRRYAAHGVYFCRKRQHLWGKMQNRFDGRLGFPGGLIDPSDATIIDGLNREVFEEMGCQDPRIKFNETDFLCAHFDHKSKLTLACFYKELTPDVYSLLEQSVFGAKHYGTETLGICQVPCFILRDGKGGLPVFLKNRFAGIAAGQLLMMMLRIELFTQDELKNILEMVSRAK